MSEPTTQRKRRKTTQQEKDDDEYHIETPAPTRRKVARKGKSDTSKKTSSHATTTVSHTTDETDSGILGPVPIIPLNSPRSNCEGIEEEDMRDCFDLLCKFIKMPAADPFLEPVDYVTLELWQYPQYIKHPMDLGTIKKMLQHNCLENPGHFADHVRLVFKNAMDFNQTGSGIYNDAENLLQLFEEQFKLLCDKWNAGESSENKDDDKKDYDNEEKDKLEIEELQQNIKKVKSNIAAYKKQIDQLKKSRKRQTKLKSFRLTSPNSLLSYKEKEELCRLILELEPEDLPSLVKIIQEANPDYGTGGGSDGEFEIDIERIDDLTLLDVKKYVERCTQHKRRSGARSNRTRRTQPEPVVDKERIDMATIQTTQRINEIQRQILDIKNQI
jgi:hypothetical protein